MKIKEIQPTGEWVVLKAVEVKQQETLVKSAGGIILPNGQTKPTGQDVNSATGKKTVDIFVHALGNKVPEDCGFKVGDMCLIDNYDAQTVGDDDNQLWAICHYTKVKAVLEIER